MKITYVVALLMIVLLVGCAAPPEVPDEPAPPEVPAVPEVPEEEVEVEVEVVTGDITVTNAGFDPAELEVPVGSVLTILAVEGRHQLTVDGKTVPAVEEGTGYDVTLDEAGEVRIFDILTKKTAIITVTE